MDGDRVCVFFFFFSLLPCCFLLGGALLAIGADRPDGGCDGGGCALRPSLAAAVSQTLLNEEDTFHRYVASQPFVRYVQGGVGGGSPAGGGGGGYPTKRVGAPWQVWTARRRWERASLVGLVRRGWRRLPASPLLRSMLIPCFGLPAVRWQLPPPHRFLVCFFCLCRGLACLPPPLPSPPPPPPLHHLPFPCPLLLPSPHSGVEHTLGTTRAAVATLRERVDRQELAAASASASASAAAHHRGGRRAQRQQEEEERAEEAALVDVVRQKRQTKYVLRGGGRVDVVGRQRRFLF